MKKTKIGQGYWQSGYGKGFKKAPIIYLINGKAYARDKYNYDCSFQKSEFINMVMVNKLVSGDDITFYQVSLNEHINFV